MFPFELCLSKQTKLKCSSTRARAAQKMPLPTPAQIAPLLSRITAWIMTLGVGTNYIPKAADCHTSTGTGCQYIFINGNLARVLLASYKITGNTTHLAEGLKWCDTLVKLQHYGTSGDGKQPVGWWDTGYEELYIADTGTAVTALALCYDLADGHHARRSAYMDAMLRFARFVQYGVNRTPQCEPILPGHTSCSYDGNQSQTSNGWIKGPHATPALDAGGLGDGYYKGSVNLPPYTISTALTGGVFFTELYALTDAGARADDTADYASISHGAVGWLLAHMFANGTIPYIIDPPTSEPHEYQCITYSAEAFIDLHLRFGESVLPQLQKLNATIGFLLQKQGPTGQLLPGGTPGEIERSPRSASLMQWWYMAVDPTNERLAMALKKYLVDWLQSEEGAKAEGVASRAMSSGFIGLVAADLIQPWSTFVQPRY
jgi:hypothetical protein